MANTFILANKAVKHYANAKIDRDSILGDNKGKSGIYLWYNRKNLKSYIGQSKDLGDPKKGRLLRYYHNSYLNAKNRGGSKIRAALLKYGHDNFSVFILEYCSVELLDKREQYWLDLLSPEYNILTNVKSSRGYKHTADSLTRMRGKRPNFIPNPEHLKKLVFLAKTREYDQSFRDAISARNGKTVYVYDTEFKLVNTYTSLIKLKKAYGIQMHHKTLYKHIAAGKLFNGHIFSFSIIENKDQVPTFTPLNKANKAKKIQLINILNPNLSKTLDSLNSAAAYIKEIDGSSDKATIRKHMLSEPETKLYKKKWKIIEIK